LNIMRCVAIEPSFEAWRPRARELLAEGVAPESIDWTDATQTPSLFEEAAPADAAGPSVPVPAAFLSLAASVCAHTDPRRFAVLYRLLFRLTRGGEKHLLDHPADPDTRQCQAWAKAVGRDVHKMHAFVRFRLLGSDPATGREQFAAWYEPEYRIVRLAAPFFQRRFANMDWCIGTPVESLRWEGAQLQFLPGLRRDDLPAEDAHDELWRAYYRSIFNPARLKIRAMQSEMPRKFWSNLPEARLIPDLIAGSETRVRRMIATAPRAPKPRGKRHGGDAG
jgi:DNA polymerase